MARVIVRLLLVTVGTFSLTTLMRGDPAQALAGDQATHEQLAQVRAELHLGDPAPVRYVGWLGDGVRGNLGGSVATHRSVASELRRRWPVTASLAVTSMVLAFVG